MADWGSISFPEFMPKQSFTLLSVKWLIFHAAVKQVSVSQCNYCYSKLNEASTNILEGWNNFEDHESYQLCGWSWRTGITRTVSLSISYENTVYLNSELWAVYVKGEGRPICSRDSTELQNPEFVPSLRLGLLYLQLSQSLSLNCSVSMLAPFFATLE